jgi:hypothetical protein
MPCRDGRDNKLIVTSKRLPVHSLEGRLDRATRAGCEMASLLMTGQAVNLSAATRKWIQEHQRADAERAATEIPESALIAASLDSLGERVAALEAAMRPTKVYGDDLPAVTS